MKSIRKFTTGINTKIANEANRLQKSLKKQEIRIGSNLAINSSWEKGRYVTYYQ